MIEDKRTKYGLGFEKDGETYMLTKDSTAGVQYKFYRFVNVSEDSSKLEVIFLSSKYIKAYELLTDMKQIAKEEKELGRNYISEEEPRRNSYGKSLTPRIYKLKEKIDAILENDIDIIEVKTTTTIKL